MDYSLTFVTGPAKINHVSANSPSYIFANICSSQYSIPFPLISKESSLNFAVVIGILMVHKLCIEQSQKMAILLRLIFGGLVTCVTR